MCSVKGKLSTFVPCDISSTWDALSAPQALVAGCRRVMPGPGLPWGLTPSVDHALGSRLDTGCTEICSGLSFTSKQVILCSQHLMQE